MLQVLVRVLSFICGWTEVRRFQFDFATVSRKVDNRVSLCQSLLAQVRELWNKFHKNYEGNP